MFSTEFTKWLADILKRQGAGALFGVIVLYMGHCYVEWIGVNVVIPVVTDHREFLRTTSKAIDEGVQIDRRTEEKITLLRETLTQQRKLNGDHVAN